MMLTPKNIMKLEFSTHRTYDKIISELAHSWFVDLTKSAFVVIRSEYRKLDSNLRKAINTINRRIQIRENFCIESSYLFFNDRFRKCRKSRHFCNRFFIKELTNQKLNESYGMTQSLSRTIIKNLLW